jgi:hypothetical protein
MGIGIPEAIILITVVGVWVFAIFMIFNLVRSTRPLGEKLLWSIAMLVLPPVSIAYYFANRQNRTP